MKPNDPVTLDGKPGKVVTTDRQLNTFTKGLIAWPGLVVGGIAAWGMVGFIQGVLAGANLAGIGPILAAGGLVVGAAINLAIGAFGALRPVDPTKPR